MIAEQEITKWQRKWRNISVFVSFLVLLKGSGGENVKIGLYDRECLYECVWVKKMAWRKERVRLRERHCWFSVCDCVCSCEGRGCYGIK